ERLVAKREAGARKKKGHVGEAVNRGDQNIQPGHDGPIVNDEFAHIIQLEMRDDVINGSDNGCGGFTHSHGDFMEETADIQYSDGDDEDNGHVRRGCAQHYRTKERHGDDNAEHLPQKPKRLKISGNGKGMVARGADQTEKEIKNNQGETGREPAAGKFPHHHLPSRDRFGEERKDGAALTLRRNLASGRGDGDDQGRNQYQEEANRLDETDDLIVVEKIHQPHDEGDEAREEEQDVEVLPAIDLFDDDGGNGEDFVHTGSGS